MAISKWEEKLVVGKATTMQKSCPRENNKQCVIYSMPGGVNSNIYLVKSNARQI